MTKPREVAALAAVLLICCGLTAAAARARFYPPGVADYWLACGLAIGPAFRGPWRLMLPALGVALLAGTWIGKGTLPWTAAAGCAVGVVHVAAVAWGLRHVVPGLLADRQPIYRVRLAHLTRFLFAVTLPASLLAGVLVAVIGVAGDQPAAFAWRAALLHGAASGLSVAVLAPLMWWDRLRAVSWLAAGAAALGAAGVSALAAIDGGMFWLAPVVVIVAGYAGSTWLAVVAVASLGASILFLAHQDALPVFGGPEGFVVFLLVIWRLLCAGLVASLWADRRAASWRQPAGTAGVLATAAVAWRRWQAAERPPRGWLVTSLERRPSEGTTTAPHRLSPGSSLHMRGALHRIAAACRTGDRVVGLGAHGALVLLQLRGDAVPDPAGLAARLQAAAGPDFVVGRHRRSTNEAVTFLIASATYLEGLRDEERDDERQPLQADPPPAPAVMPT